MFQRLTHLELVWNPGEEWQWTTLLELRYLTHLSVEITFSLPDCVKRLKEIISSCKPSLMVVVVWLPSNISDSSREFEDAKAISDGSVDMRLVLAFMGSVIEADNLKSMYGVVRSFPDLLRDWSGRSIGKDFWTQAEETIAERYQRLKQTLARKDF
ncbi:hypothetical protein H1R20_g3847, partial [Candolleomyces eurysporus]